MSLFNYDKSEHERSLQPPKKREPIKDHPEGEYDGTISEAKVKIKNDRGGEYVLLLLETRAGKAWTSLEFNNPKTMFVREDGKPFTVADMGRENLKKIILGAYKKDAKIPEGLSTCADVARELKGLPVRAKVKHTVSPDGNRTFVNVRFGKPNEIDRISERPTGNATTNADDVDSEEVPF